MKKTSEKRVRKGQYKIFIEKIGKCELCGDTRRLQLHHILPLSLVPDDGDYDIEDNWMVVCEKCHSLLTPKNLLTKASIGHRKRGNELLKTCPYKYCMTIASYNDRIISFYEEINGLASSKELLTATSVLDVFDKHFSDDVN